MRFRLTLSSKTLQSIPFNYHYPISCWIYRVFQRTDPEFSGWLHAHGYAFNGARKFKMFTFSNLRPAMDVDRKNGCFKARENELQLDVSLLVEEDGNRFIAGLFRDQPVEIADRTARGEFTVKSVIQLKEPDFDDGIAEIRTGSPLVVSRPRVDPDGKMRADYLHPTDEDYSTRLRDNLLHKYAAANNLVIAQTAGMHESVVDFPFDVESWQFIVKSEPRKRGQFIKIGRPEQTKIIGYDFHFRLAAHQELLRFAWQAGLGEKGSLGFGCVDVVNDLN